MSEGQDEDSGSYTDLSTARGRDWPSVRQFETSDNRIVSVTVVDSADCAIIRLVLKDPERALEVFQQAKLPVTESDLLVVQLPDGPQPLLQICKALLGAELNIHYAYPLLIGPAGNAALALHVEDHEAAARVLERSGFVLFTEGDLG